ncbi:MAG: hypothetical protein M1815_004763 [Lichina confinis]|nr:MAG: hypothetical protein M1815_004763 [Lichina confinis]
MARDKLDFTEYTLLDEPVEFRTAGDHSIEATGEGTISVAFSSGDWTLRRVYHVPGPPWNVMSVHVLASNGFFVWFGETSASVLDKEATGVVEEASLVETEKVAASEVERKRKRTLADAVDRLQRGRGSSPPFEELDKSDELRALPDSHRETF